MKFLKQTTHDSSLPAPLQFLIALGLLLLCAHVLSIRSVHAEDITPTPTQTPERVRTEEEKKEISALWNDAMEAFQARKYSKASEHLEKMIAKYPAEAQGQGARYYLGQSLLFSGKTRESIPQFQSSIEALGKTPESAEARLYLGRAYLDASQFTEAYLVSEEIIKITGVHSTYRSKALLLRAQAQVGLKQNVEAEKTLASFQAAADQDPELENELANSFLISLLLKGNRCNELPSSKTLSEEILVSELTRKSVCILEMAGMLSKGTRRLGAKEVKSSTEPLFTALEHFAAVAKKPPLDLSKKKKKEAETAVNELKTRIYTEIESTRSLIEIAWQDKEPLAPALKRLKEWNPAAL